MLAAGLLKAHDIDGDGDGVPDAEDKCPSDANTGQLDGDDAGDLFTSVGCQTLLVHLA